MIVLVVARVWTWLYVLPRKEHKDQVARTKESRREECLFRSRGYTEVFFQWSGREKELQSPRKVILLVERNRFRGTWPLGPKLWSQGAIERVAPVYANSG
ncbi:hypothetical protein WN55_00560 [Dufourea novaeangliae]|uniref:Uncharacterized protein n=1 Tax=Dufourea novaeangliae TaxID=178035 RepID=A0A154PEQ7_DUFNO|nr:hypothetical protein WN55_00560 [Dufourea novaeangliae]